MKYRKPTSTSPCSRATASAGEPTRPARPKNARMGAGTRSSLAWHAPGVSARAVGTNWAVRSTESNGRPTSSQWRRRTANFRRASSGVYTPPAQATAARFVASAYRAA